MDRIQKFVSKLSGSEAERVFEAIKCVRVGHVDTLSVKKLKGYVDYYRVRVGRVRIIFTKIEGRNVIIEVEFRNDHTY
jgi:mRNA-degrading endonuclease RelE of RelBE toxin-antitoxin system